VVLPLTTERFQEQVVEEEPTVLRQREEGTCYGAALGARPPRGPVLAAGNSWCMIHTYKVAALLGDTGRESEGIHLKGGRIDSYSIGTVTGQLG
jgi:hypothetical protein